MEEKTKNKTNVSPHIREKPEVVQRPREKHTTPHDSTAVCPVCGMQNEQNALFCEECGKSVTAAGACPYCGAYTLPGADVCEQCGTWLLEGRCAFCYAPVEKGQAFCEECGNPVRGVQCPKCGTTGCFDFCKHCNTPVTAGAIAELERVDGSPEDRQLKDIYERLARLRFENKQQQESEPESVASRELSSLFSPEQKRRITSSRAQVNKQQARQEREKKQLEEEERRRQDDVNRRAEEELKAREQAQWRQQEACRRQRQERLRQQEELERQVAEKAKVSRTFHSNQEARRYFNAIRPGLGDDLAWKCYAYNTIHRGGPDECANPEEGGVWGYFGDE